MRDPADDDLYFIALIIRGGHMRYCITTRANFWMTNSSDQYLAFCHRID